MDHDKVRNFRVQRQMLFIQFKVLVDFDNILGRLWFRVDVYCLDNGFLFGQLAIFGLLWIIYCSLLLYLVDNDTLDIISLLIIIVISITIEGITLSSLRFTHWVNVSFFGCLNFCTTSRMGKLGPCNNCFFPFSFFTPKLFCLFRR